MEVRVARVEVAGTDCNGLLCDIVRDERVPVPVMVPVLVTVDRTSLRRSDDRL